MINKDDQALIMLAGHVGIDLVQRGLMLASVESCTGGWLGQAITAKAGSSGWYERGFITYSIASKQEMLGVSAITLKQHGTVSEQTVKEMAAGALTHSCAQVSVAISGIAGPNGGTEEKPVGMICFAWKMKDGLARSSTHYFGGDRESIRRQAVFVALQGVVDLLHDSPPLSS
jgi:nicotinamide-nucleotide amidase